MANLAGKVVQLHPAGPNDYSFQWSNRCCACRTVRVTALGCGPSGAAGNPTVHPVPGAFVQVHDAGSNLVGSGVANGLGVVEIPVPSAATYTISGVDPDGTLAGSLSQAVTCGSGATNVLPPMTADEINYACLRGVMYRAIQTSLSLTDSQGTRTIVYGQNLRGTTAVIWDCCVIASSPHADAGSCVLTTADIRFTWEFGARFDIVSGLWQPTLTQVWKAFVCPPPNKYPIIPGQTCPPPNPSGVSEFNSTASRIADLWSPGPPFTATFTFPVYAFSSLGSAIDEHWLPMSGTVTISETPMSCDSCPLAGRCTPVLCEWYHSGYPVKRNHVLALADDVRNRRWTSGGRPWRRGCKNRRAAAGAGSRPSIR